MTSNTELYERYGWWSSLKHGGLLISPTCLAEAFPEEAPPLSGYMAERLRRDVIRILDGDTKHLPVLMSTTLEGVLGLNSGGWSKGNDVDAIWARRSITRETLKPRWLWQGPNGALLPVFVAEAKGTRQAPARLGIGRGRRDASRVIEWLRKAGQKLAVLTNGRQWRLIHAGTEYDAWCEWDANLWFQEGQPSSQVTALRLLLAGDSLTPEREQEPSKLLKAVLESRKGQAELSSVLGERVRRAVEELIQSSSAVLEPLDQTGESHVSRRDLYIAASRMIMRCVVILFAEARELLPLTNPRYHESYGLQGLREQLERRAGGRARERLRHSYGAWPRLQALFRLVHDGSVHEGLPVQRYGGELYRPGQKDSSDPVHRALAAFEDPSNTLDDATVHRILELLTRSKVKVRQGNRSTTVEAPVDFSDLSSEYIGILYEGLLDFELRRAEKDHPVVFLNAGNQPALPLDRLEAMSSKDMKELFEKLKKESKKKAAVEEEDPEDDETEEPEDEDEQERETSEEAAADAEPEKEQGNDADDDQQRIYTEMVGIWASKAVRAAKLVKYPKKDADPLVREQYNRDEAAAAKKLVDRTVLPGEWYLVRWGGTRKGSGTFYTRPQLASPTARRTLQPLAYEPVATTTDAVSGLETVTEWKPRTPEEILALKVCDPAMGSGSFLVSALRFLGDALVDSLHVHERFKSAPEGTICKLADGLSADHPSQETLPVQQDHEEFEDRLRARLKRHLVERCIYGVDLDPLAVELGRLSLWVETMDPRLPFGFLDHKLKCGNSLVGCWFDRFQDYPVMAWEREGGDKNHDRFVHHFREYEATRGKKRGEKLQEGDKWTQAIKDFRNEIVKPELADWIKARGGKGLLLPEGLTAEGLHDSALAVFEELHALPVHESEERAALYREKVLGDTDLQHLKSAFDTWCAIWFWPGEEIDYAPTPMNFLEPPSETAEIVTRVATDNRFFHWELEFPDVFTRSGSGFDALIGNPPWEIQKPNSKEFFSNIDPLYRTYGKQEALRRQTQYFESTGNVEGDWLVYSARLKALSNWTKHAAFPFGDPEDDGDRFTISRGNANLELHRLWRDRRLGRKGYSDPRHPFRHQGSADINTYKMFLELAHALARKGGHFGFLVPSGVYTDKGSTALRELFLSECSWRWLFGFENREGIFKIHRSFKFGPVIVEKGGETAAIRAAFMHRNLDDWEQAERFVLGYPRDRVEQFSPKSKAILEIRSERDLEVLSKLYANGVLLGDQGPDGWGIKYATEFHMTNDSKLFPPRPKWEANGYRGDEYGHWLKGGWKPYDGPKSILERPKDLVLSAEGTEAIKVTDIEDVALPLYEGRMIGQFDFSKKGWVTGKGRSAVWRDIPFEEKSIEPQYLMAFRTAIEKGAQVGIKAPLMNITSATNSRSVICSAITTSPCNHALNPITVQPSGSDRALPTLAFVALANSFAFDYLVRARLGGLNLSFFVLDEVVLPNDLNQSVQSLVRCAASLSFPNESFAGYWHRLHSTVASRQMAWRTLWASTPRERLRLKSISDALAAQLFGLDYQSLAWVLEDCDLLGGALESANGTLNPKGFWRTDKAEAPELRHTVLSQIAFHDLQEKGLQAFLEQNDGEGWMLPETLRLADYGLGHDDSAKEPQPVASRLGPRFYDWQLEQSAEESWEECERHAELIATIVPPATEGEDQATEESGEVTDSDQGVLFSE